MKKRLISLCLVFCFMLSALAILPACKKKNNNNEGNNNNGDNGALLTQEEILNQNYKGMIDSVEADLAGNITIFASAGAGYELAQITEGRKAQPTSMNMGLGTVVVKCDNGNYYIKMTEGMSNDPEIEEVYIYNGYGINIDDYGYYEVSDISQLTDVLKNGAGSLDEIVNFTKIMEAIREVSSYFGEVTAEIKPVENGTNIEISISFEQKLTALLNVIIADKNEMPSKAINDIVKVLTGKEFNVMEFLNKYIDMIDEETTIGDVLDIVKREFGIDIEDIYNKVAALLDEIVIYESVEQDFYESYSVLLKKTNKILSEFSLEEIKEYTVYELIRESMKDDDDEEEIDVEASGINAVMIEDEEELTYNEMAKLFLNNMLNNQEVTFVAFLEEMIGMPEEVFETMETISIKNFDVNIVASMDANGKLSAITLSAEGAVEIVAEGNGNYYGGSANISIEFYDRGVTTFTLPAGMVARKIEIDRNIVVNSSSTGDIVIDLTDTITFCKSFEIKVTYVDDESNVAVVSYDKTTKKLTISREFIEKARTKLADGFDSIYFDYSDYMKVTTEDGDQNMYIRFSGHLIIG